MRKRLIAKLLNCFIATTGKNNLTTSNVVDAMQQYNKRNFQRGFTLVELLISVSLIGIISAIGTAGIIDFSNTAKLNAAASEVATILNVAKSNSLSQLKNHPLCTSSDELNGYKVRIINSTSYDLVIRCGGADRLPAISTKTLPNGITFDNSSVPSSFLFQTLKIGAIITGNSPIRINAYGKVKNVIVDSTSGIIR